MKSSTSVTFVLATLLSTIAASSSNAIAEPERQQPPKQPVTNASKIETTAKKTLQPIGGVKTDPVGAASVQTLRMPSIVFETETISVGNIAIPDARISVDTKTVSIRQRLIDDPFPLLKGTVLRYEDDAVGGGKRHVTGIAYFNEGQLCSQLPNNDSPNESVFRSNGAIEGKIIVSDRMGIMVQSRDGSFTRIDPSTISYVRSPRAFVFSLVRSAKTESQPGNVTSLTFQPTTAATSISMSSVVLPKDKSLEDQLLDEEDDSILFGKRSVRDTMDGDGLQAPPLNGRTKPFPNWP